MKSTKTFSRQLIYFLLAFFLYQTLVLAQNRPNPNLRRLNTNNITPLTDNYLLRTNIVRPNNFGTCENAKTKAREVCCHDIGRVGQLPIGRPRTVTLQGCAGIPP
ncbi:MAG: hypothetical protein WCG27_09170, partial [Pseudomonadota bacterium]